MRNDLAFVFMVFGSVEFRFHQSSPEPPRKVSGNLLATTPGSADLWRHKTPLTVREYPTHLCRNDWQPKRFRTQPRYPLQRSGGMRNEDRRVAPPTSGTSKWCQAFTRITFSRRDFQPRPDCDQARLANVKNRHRFHRARDSKFSIRLNESRASRGSSERAENRSERLTSY